VGEWECGGSTSLSHSPNLSISHSTYLDGVDRQMLYVIDAFGEDDETTTTRSPEAVRPR
jgi:hypothetical protein